MATLNLGRLKPVFRGAWNNATAYNVDDIVVRTNQSYISIQAGTNQDPATATAYWTLMAAKGTDGTDVGATLTTQGDVLYRDGSGLQRLAKGTAAQVLKMNTAANAPEWGTVDSAPLIKSYVRMCKGGSSISGFSAGSPAHFSAYDFTFTPQTTSSVFVIDVNFLIGSHQDHTFIQYRYDHSGASNEYLGTGKASFYNSNTHFDFGSFRVAADSNVTLSKSNIFYLAPNTTNAITLKVFIGQHSNTAYFGRSSSSSSDDYTGLGMSLRVDEYSSAGSNTIQYSEVTS